MNAAGIFRNAAGQEEVMHLYTQALEHWPVPYTTHEVATRQGTTFVIESGPASGPVLVLVHGACSNALSWMGDVATYAGRFRVLAVDVPGEAGRSAPRRPSHQGPAFADWLGDVLEGLGVTSVSLLGISKGGFISLKFATTYPDRVERLVLLTPAGIAPARPSFLLRAIPLSLLGGWGRARINKITFGRDEVDPGAVLFMDVIMRNFRPEVTKPYLFTDEELRRLTMPVLLAVGADDALLDAPKMVARAKALLPGAHIWELPGRGHVLVGMADMIAPFLEGTAAAA